MRKSKTKRDPGRLQVGDRVRARLPAAVIEGEVIEDRGGLGIGGRQMVTIRTLDEPDFPPLMDFLAEELELVQLPVGEKVA